MSQRNVAASGLLVALLALTACSGPEARVERYVERSQQYLDEMNYDKARIEISNALQIDPKSVPARVLAGHIAEKQVKARDAVANYQAAVDVDPQNIEARAALGRLYLLGGLADKAHEAIGPALEKAPDDPRLLTVRGALRAIEGDLAGAMADAEAAVRGLPTDENALALLAAQYQRAERADDAIAVLEKGLEARPDAVDLRFILAELHMRAGNPDLAEVQIRTAADSNRSVLGYWQQLARFHLLQKDPDGAEQAMRDAVKYNPESVEAKSSLVSLLATRKGVEAAQAQMLEYVEQDPDQHELRIALGQFHEASGKLKEAEAQYRQVIDADGVKPRGIEARDRLAALLVRQEKISEAQLLIGEVLAENPRDNDALVLRAGIALSRNETVAAITDLRSVLRDQPNSQPLMRVLARAHLQDNDVALAEEVLRNAVQVNPADEASRMDLAAVLVQTGRPQLAMPILEQLARDSPDNMTVRETRFRLQLAQDDLEGAARTAEEVKSLRPDLKTGYLLTGALLERKKDYPAALRQYELALRYVDEPMQVLPLLVQTDLRAGQPQQAASRLSAYLQKRPDVALAHEMLGEVRLAQGDSAAAIASFGKAVELDPKLWVAYRGKAIAHDRAGQSSLALATIEKGFAASGSVELGMDLAGRQDRLGNHDAAIRVYQDLHTRLPESLPVANNLAMMLVNRRSDAASLEQAERLGALLAASAEPSYLDTRGWIMFRRGQVEQALPLLQHASEKAPQSREILYHLGMAQFRSGDRSSARQSLEAALASNPDFVGADEARATLSALRGSG